MEHFSEFVNTLQPSINGLNDVPGCNISFLIKQLSISGFIFVEKLNHNSTQQSSLQLSHVTNKQVSNTRNKGIVTIS